jgi:hypothetical protein
LASNKLAKTEKKKKKKKKKRRMRFQKTGEKSTLGLNGA